MSRLATATEILALLRGRPDDVRGLLGEPSAQLSLPTDGRGARILARVPYTPHQSSTKLVMSINDIEVVVPVQLLKGIETFRVSTAKIPYTRV